MTGGPIEVEIVEPNQCNQRASESSCNQNALFFIRSHDPSPGWECAKWISIAKGHFSSVNQTEGCFSPDAADFDRKPVKSTNEKKIFPLLSLPGFLPTRSSILSDALRRPRDIADKRCWLHRHACVKVTSHINLSIF